MDQQPDSTQANPTSVAEARAMLEQIAQRVNELSSEYNQLQLRAAWLQGWIANQPASQSSPKKNSTKKS